MKLLTLFAILGVTTILPAQAAQVTVAYPTFQGRPILATMPRHDSPMRSTVDANAHAACRLMGYYSAAYASRIGSTTNSYRYVVRPGTEVFNPLSIIDRGALPYNGFNVHYNGTGLAPTPTPQHLRTPRNHRCLEMTTCRGMTPIDFRSQESFEYNRSHAYVRECGRWAVTDESSYAVFTSLTCESFPGDASHLESRVRTSFGLLHADMNDYEKRQLVQHQVNAFHQSTQNRFRAVGGRIDQMGITFENQEAICASHGNSVQGSIVHSRRGQCEFQPYRVQWNQVLGRTRMSINTEVSFHQYLMDTGRLVVGPKTGPACAREILEKYHNAVLPEEYGLTNAYGISKPFCVNTVGTASISGGQCVFQVGVEDFMRVPSTLRIAFGGELSDNDLQRRCDELAACFGHTSLNCSNSGFCPAPGTVSRSTR
jgi:hypothetical protein